ncbi:MAG: serine/threonine-protein kinase [Aggregatilineales bacterium]
MTETELSTLYSLGTSIDTFALGHYARVFEARQKSADRMCAFKVLRPEHMTTDGQPRWEVTAFPHEAELLMKLASLPAVTRLYDCGYVESAYECPRDKQMASFGLDVAAFRAMLPDYLARRWRPYLAEELLPRAHNLLYVMKPNTPGSRWRLPTEEGLDLALQFADLLNITHRQRIVYLDHKLEHVYWDGTTLRLIDWNSSRLVTEGEAGMAAHVQSDLHHLCVGILYPIFTGLSPQKGTLVPQPSDQPGVEGRYSDVNHLDFGVEPTLSAGLQLLLEQGARRQLVSAEQVIAALSRIASAYGWDAPDGVRAQVRAGLHRLREGQDSIRTARDLLRDAAVMDDVSDELDGELRRLLARINEMLNSRAVP